MGDMMTNETLCIYHDNCNDGFGAAWALSTSQRATKTRIKYYAGQYQQPPPDVSGRNVILVDFSYPSDVIQEMRKSARHVLIIDHHKTAINDLRTIVPDFDGRCPLELVLDVERSGAALAWNYFHGPDETMPAIIKYIEDRDLWRKNLPGSDQFTAWLYSYPHDMAVWTVLNQNAQLDQEGRLPGDILMQGEAIIRNNKRQIDLALKHSWAANIAGYEVAITHSTAHFSEIARALSRGMPFGACIFLAENATKVVFSLRSESPDGVDVSEVAKKFGGGGHKHAAGFSVPIAELNSEFGMLPPIGWVVRPPVDPDQ